MATLYDSGWINGEDGDKHTIDLTGKHVLSATVQFRGIDGDIVGNINGSDWTDIHGTVYKQESVPSQPPSTRFQRVSGYCEARFDDIYSDAEYGDARALIDLPGRSAKETLHRRWASVTDGHGNQVTGTTYFEGYTRWNGEMKWGVRHRGYMQPVDPRVILNDQTTAYSGTLYYPNTSDTYELQGVQGDAVNELEFKVDHPRTSGWNHPKWEARVIIDYVVAPEIGTNPATGIEPQSATLHGEVLYDGGGVAHRWFEYAKNEADLGTAEGETVTVGSGEGEFSATLHNLDVNSLYYFRAVAENEKDRVHGDVLTFETDIAFPEVETLDPEGIDTFEATLKGYFGWDGGDPEAVAGFEWATNSGLNNSQEHSFGDVADEQGFEYLLDGLDFETDYWFRFWAENDRGRTNGDTVHFQTLYPWLPAPSEAEPEAAYRTEDRQPVFEFTLGENEENPANNYNARLRISDYIAMEPAVVYESMDGTSNWEYLDGVEWKSMPAHGVSPNTRVRCSLPGDLPVGQHYWDCASYDGDRYNLNIYPRLIRILASIEGIYTLEIDGVEWEPLTYTVLEASNGEIGEIYLEFDNEGFEAEEQINHGDRVELGILDFAGRREDFAGRVRRKNPEGQIVEVVAILGDGVLSERVIEEDYPEQDIGLTVKQIIETYCLPLTANNVKTDTGFIAPVKAEGRTAVRVLESLRRSYGVYYFVDADWDMNFYTPDDVDEAKLAVRRGDD